MKKSKIFNIPNILSLFRIAIIPLMLFLFYLDMKMPEASWPALLNVLVFFIAGITDYFDGAIARAMKQTTLLGKFLDASTDKMLVGVSLMLLIAFDRLEGWWIVPAMIIYLREIFVSGMREFTAYYKIIVPISRMGKWKLAIQMCSIGALIGGTHSNLIIPYGLEIIGYGGFLVATIITAVSGWSYVRYAWPYIRKMDDEEQI